MTLEKLTRRPEFFLPLALLLLALNLTLSLRTWRQFRILTSNVRKSTAVLDHSERLLIALGDAETGQRGFLLTGRNEYLRPYDRGKLQAPLEMTALRQSVSSPEERDRVESIAPLVSQKLNELRLTIDLMKSSGAKAALALVNSDEGKMSMDAIRDLCGQIETSEHLRLTHDERASGDSMRQVTAITTTGSVMVFALLVIALYVIGGANRERERLIRELHERGELLEKKTIELGQSLAEKTKTEERFQLVVEASPSAMIMVGADGLITLINDQTEKLFGYGRRELLGRPMEMLVPERFRAGHGGHRSGFFAAPSTRSMGAGRDLFGLRRDGSEVPVEIGLNPIITSDGQFVLASIIDITERRKTEERFQLVVEAAPSAMIMVGADGLITLVNTQTEKLFGYDRGELLGRAMEMLVPERFRASHGGHRSGFFAAPSTRSMGAGRDLFGLRRDGSEVPVEIGLNPIITSDGQFVLASVIDITERRQREEELRDRTARLKEQAALLELAHDAIFVTEHKANGILFWNGGAAELYGWRAEEARGHSSHDVLKTVFPQPLAEIEAELERKGKWEGELIHTRSDGSIITVASRWALRRDDCGNPVAVLKINRDITSQKSAAKALHDVHDRLNLALKGGGIGTWTWNVREDEWNCDDRLAALFGLTSGAAIADVDSFVSLVHPDDRAHVRTQLERGPETGSCDAEFRVPLPDATMRVIVSHGEISQEAGKSVRLTGISWDITERKRVEAELQAKAAEMERFTYTVSHDLKSPLITIKSYVTMIDGDLAAGTIDRARSDLDRISKAADKMNRLLEELLALSRVGRVQNAPETVSFRSLVEEALELVAGAIRDRHIRVEVAEKLPFVTVDRSRIVEVLQNLIDNASKFMGGQTEPEIRIGASNVGAETRFFVKDNGIGVDRKHHERIFGLFDKLDPKSGGSGAGLAIVKRIVETLGGRIWIESPGNNGGGCTFWFTLI